MFLPRGEVQHVGRVSPRGRNPTLGDRLSVNVGLRGEPLTQPTLMLAGGSQGVS